MTYRKPSPLAERVSLTVTGIVRTWSFLGVCLVLTVVWWVDPRLFRDPNLLWWMAGASLMAILMEGAVGIGQRYQQQRSDQILAAVAEDVRINKAALETARRAEASVDALHVKHDHLHAKHDALHEKVDALEADR